MKFSASALAAIVVASSVGNHASAFTASHRRVVSLAKTAEVPSRTTSTNTNKHGSACQCPSCQQCSCCGFAAGLCRCFFFARTTGDISPTRLFSSNVDAVDSDETLPAAVEALDGIESADELHNLERPARQSIAKRPGGGSRSSGRPLAEYTIGETVTGTVKTLTAYGAFIDIGAESDGLLHISNLAAAFVADVKEVLQPGQECQVRILEINSEKKQLALTMLTSEEQSQADAKKQQSSSRASGGGGGGASNVKKNSILINQLIELDIDPDTFVTGTVVNIVEFGAFVRIDCSQFDDAITGEIDGLVHVSQLQGGSGRVSVADVVQEGQEVQVRLKNIDGQKISLTMMSVEDEQAKMDDDESSGGGGSRGERGDRGGGFDDDGEVDPHPGNREWEASYAENMVGQPEFRNGAVLWTTNKKK